MALGKKIWVWDADEMAKGVSTSDDFSDGGFSPLTDHVNLINTPGVCYHPASATDASTNLTGQMIASCEDPSNTYSRLFVSTDDGADGRFFSLSASNVLTARGSEDTGADYVQGKTDMAAYKNEVYITNSQYVVRWSDIGGANTFNTTFFDFTSVSPTPAANATTAPHPCLVYEDNIYYGNGNILLRQTSAGGTPATVLTLPAGQVIVTLGIDPGSGKMLISVVGQINLSDTKNSDARVLYYNGFANKVDKVVLTDSMVTAFPTSEGQLYAAFGSSLGYWNGSGITFLYEFNNIGFNNEQMLYKHHFTNIDSTLYFIVRSKIYAHGPIQQGGQHVFYPAYNNTPGGVATDLTNVTNIGSGLLSFSYATSKFFTWSTTSVSTTATQSLYSNENDFREANDGIWLRRVRIFWKNQISNNASPGSLSFLNEDGTITTVGNSGIFSLQNTSGAAKAMTEIVVGGGAGLRVYQLQWRLILDTINPGIRRIEVFGDPANLS